MNETIFFIEGDGIGPEVWRVSRTVLDAAVHKAYNGTVALHWKPLLAGEAALEATGELLPEATRQALQTARYAIKGPLNTPVGKGFRSLNVTLRQTLDLYACIRPVRHYHGIVSPVKHPEKVDMVIFRENTEDVYQGIEYKSGTPEVKKLIAFLHDEMGVELDPSAGVGIKPMTAKRTKRLVKKAIEYALQTSRPSVTVMHKGNIMKYTEGAFRAWAYEAAEEYFKGQFCLEGDTANPGTLVIKDRIADAMFQEALLHPENYSVIATPNLNGDYISDALAAQVGGLGMAPGVNKSDTLSFYEATHGTAPTIAGKDMANPCSMLLSGTMMLDEMGLGKASSLVRHAIDKAFLNRTVTVDLASQMEFATTVGCSRFGDILLQGLE